ncbi:SET and MYND domain-containing protein 4-like [Culicoides brevitarsis]|uniref:SET and MYND domain-containing protein 4-like n=1 Tax=Culicoides brevitarsis TaxID=469753 RepID=UPI00307CC6D8
MNPENYFKLLRANIPGFANTDLQDVHKQFNTQKDGASKIRFCLNQCKGKDVFLPASEVLHSKSDAASTYARNKGNEFFKAMDFVSAMDWYNRSICFAPADSENVGMGYANRSAIFLRSGFYKFCLENIELALDNKYPTHLHEKLENRRKECLERMKKSEDMLEKFDSEYNPPSLSYKPKKNIPFMIDDLEFEESPEFGHLIRTKRDLKPGDILIIEKPFFKHVVNDLEFKRCANCLKQNYMNLFPCSRCTRAMFCSKNCQSEADKRFHQYECKIIDGIFFLNELHLGTPVATPIRIALKAITLFDNPQNLQTLIEQSVDKSELFLLDFNNLTEELQFRTTYALATNESKRRIFEIFDFAVECAILWHLLNQFTDLPLLLKTKDCEDLFLNVLYHFYLSSIINGQALGHVIDGEEYGVAVFPFSSIVNHSCIPNVAKIFDNDTIIMYARRPIKAGDQLFDSYGQHLHHGHAKLVDRQRKLLNQFHIECHCRACRFDLPMLTEMLPARDKQFLQHSIQDLKRLMKFESKDVAKQNMKKYRQCIIDYDKRSPSTELYCSEDVYNYALWNLTFGRPLSMQLKPI